MFKLSQLSLQKLQGVHPDLIRVVKRAIELTEVDFRVLEGLRSPERQKELVAAGSSQTLNSKHLTGRAVDVVALVGGLTTWEWPFYEKIAKAFQKAADELGVKIVWGGSWKTLKDGPHFELKA